MNSHSFYEHLFERSRQITPYLDGTIEVIPDDAQAQKILHIEHPCSENIRELYETLKATHPEAGSAYWLTRTWTLLCWQPIYVAFVSIYSCGGLPDLLKIGQKVQPNFIAGYQFSDNHYTEGRTEELIVRAGAELEQLFSYFREEISHWTRIRPGFTNHLIADGILGSIVRLNQFMPDLNADYLHRQAQLWLSAFNLPLKLANTLHYDQNSSSLKLIRTSCCLVYKCDGRKLCSDCPRHPDNTRKP